MNSISRGKGHSATAAAAYRAGLAIDDPTTGVCHDYTRRQGVVSVDMLAPEGAPAWATDPHEIWGRVEANDPRKNARVARELLVALPHELDTEARHALALDLGQWLVDRYAVVAQVAIHSPDEGGDDRNFHTHILITPRQVGPEGLGDYAAKELDARGGRGAKELKVIRAAVADLTNAALERAGLGERVDHRTLAEQKASAAAQGDFKAAASLDRLPTQHEGKATTQARRRGERVPRARRNDRRKSANARRLEAHETRFQRLKDEAQAQGRLTPVDEQAAHARALLERTSEGRSRLRKAYNPTPTDRSPRNGKQQQRGLGAPLTRDSRYRGSHGHNGHAHGLGALPEVLPLNSASVVRREPGRHAGGPGTHPAGAGGLLRANASRHPSASSPLQRLRAERSSRGPVSQRSTRGVRATGDGSRESRRYIEEANAYVAAMEKAIAALLASAARALQNPDSLTPWQRSTARAVLSTHDEQARAWAAVEAAAEKRKKTRSRLRLARADAADTGQATGLAAAAMRAVGLTPAEDREAAEMREALARAKRRHGRARHHHEQVKQAHQEATQAAEKARADFAGAFGLEVPRFDKKADNEPATAATTRPQPFRKLGPMPPTARTPRPR